MDEVAVPWAAGCEAAVTWAAEYGAAVDEVAEAVAWAAVNAGRFGAYAGRSGVFPVDAPCQPRAPTRLASARSRKSSRSWPQNGSSCQTYQGAPNTWRAMASFVLAS